MLALKLCFTKQTKKSQKKLSVKRGIELMPSSIMVIYNSMYNAKKCFIYSYPEPFLIMCSQLFTLPTFTTFRIVPNFRVKVK